MKQLNQLLNLSQANPDGFTFDLDTGQPVTTGYAVAVQETQGNHGFKGLFKSWEYAKKHGLVLGGRYDSVKELYYFDAVMVVKNAKTANILARNNKQIAYFDLDTQTEIRTYICLMKYKYQNRS